jgi:hypothetical protein
MVQQLKVESPTTLCCRLIMMARLLRLRWLVVALLVLARTELAGLDDHSRTRLKTLLPACVAATMRLSGVYVQACLERDLANAHRSCPRMSQIIHSLSP